VAVQTIAALSYLTWLPSRHHVTGTPQQGELRGKIAELVTLARNAGCTRVELLGMIASAP
jgi:hypothetical protein